MESTKQVLKIEDKDNNDKKDLIEKEEKDEGHLRF